MIINVVGKERFRGTSKKTGNPYDFINIYYIGAARGVEGYRSESLMLDPKEFDYDVIRVGSDYQVDFDRRGYCIGFRAAD